MTLVLPGSGLVIFDGNSRTNGYGVTDPSLIYPKLIEAQLPSGWTMLGRAVGGRDTSQMIIDASGVNATYPSPAEGADVDSVRPGVDPYYDDTLDHNVVVVWEGLLEFTHGHETTAAGLLSKVSTYCLARRAVGFKVVVCTEIPCANDVSGNYAVLKEYNRLVRAQWRTFADGVADLGADSRFAYDGAEYDLAYWDAEDGWDGWHLGDAGYAAVAEIVAPAIVKSLQLYRRPAPRKTAAPSLLIGSDALGWQEFGGDAVLGTMTRAMPGGDGSLDALIPASAADKRRNVLTPDAECVLTLPGDTWAGLVVGEPMAGFARSQKNVALASAGLWAHAAYRRDLSYVWADSDPGQWFRIRQKYDSADPDGMVEFIDQGKFAVDTEGRLFIRGDSDRTFTGYSRGSLAYWLNKGLVDSGCRIVGLDLVYKSNFPTDWRMTVRSKEDTAWGCANDGTLEESDTTSRSSWRTLQLDLTQASTALCIALNFNTVSAGSPATDPWIKVKTVVVYCRGPVGSVDRSITVDDAMCDLATLSGLATVTRCPATLGSARTHLAIRPENENSVADSIREMAGLHANPLEYFFDRTAGAWRFTVNEAPSTVDVTRNRHWILDDRRAGESSDGVVRDYEAAPEYVRVLYLSSGVVDVPDGQPRSYCYPSEPTSFRSHVMLDTSQAQAKLTDAQAAAIAERIYEQRAAASFAGGASFGPTALTVSGQELPSYLIHPGDRVSIPGRQGASEIYVRETSYNFGSESMSATLGWPFDTLPAAAAARVYRKPNFGRGTKWNLVTR